MFHRDKSRILFRFLWSPWKRWTNAVYLMVYSIKRTWTGTERHEAQGYINAQTPQVRSNFHLLLNLWTSYPFTTYKKVNNHVPPNRLVPCVLLPPKPSIQHTHLLQESRQGRIWVLQAWLHVSPYIRDVYALQTSSKRTWLCIRMFQSRWQFIEFALYSRSLFRYSV